MPDARSARGQSLKLRGFGAGLKGGGLDKRGALRGCRSYKVQFVTFRSGSGMRMLEAAELHCLDSLTYAAEPTLRRTRITRRRATFGDLPCIQPCQRSMPQSVMNGLRIVTSHHRVTLPILRQV